jgi:hypothetical protein
MNNGHLLQISNVRATKIVYDLRLHACKCVWLCWGDEKRIEFKQLNSDSILQFHKNSHI